MKKNVILLLSMICLTGVAHAQNGTEASTSDKPAVSADWSCSAACADINIPGGATLVGKSKVTNVPKVGKSKGSAWSNKECVGVGKTSYDAAAALQKLFKGMQSGKCSNCSLNGAECKGPAGSEPMSYARAINPNQGAPEVKNTDSAGESLNHQ